MNQMHHIRAKVLKVSQKRMAEIAGCSQTTVSRWERGELAPSLTELARVRDFARSKRIRWNDKLFFEPPDCDRSAA